MNLQQWIKKMGGPTKCAKILGVNRVSTSQWALGKNLPVDRVKMQIVKLSRGEVTYQSMIEPFFKAGKK